MPGWGTFFAPPILPLSPGPGIFDLQERTIPKGTFINFETSDWSVEWIIVSVTSGSLGIWPFLNSNPVTRPPWRFIANQPPVWLPVSCPGERFCITALAQGDDDCDCSITFVSRSNRGYDYNKANG